MAGQNAVWHFWTKYSMTLLDNAFCIKRSCMLATMLLLSYKICTLESSPFNLIHLLLIMVTLSWRQPCLRSQCFIFMEDQSTPRGWLGGSWTFAYLWFRYGSFLRFDFVWKATLIFRQMFCIDANVKLKINLINCSTFIRQDDSYLFGLFVDTCM